MLDGPVVVGGAGVLGVGSVTLRQLAAYLGLRQGRLGARQPLPAEARHRAPRDDPHDERRRDPQGDEKEHVRRPVTPLTHAPIVSIAG